MIEKFFDRQKLKWVAKNCPLTYEALFGRKYHLPNYRQEDYANMEFNHFITFSRMMEFSSGRIDRRDEVIHCVLGNTAASLHYKRPTLYLERELGEALLRTDLLEDLSTGDIKWRWPALRVVLPSLLLPIARREKVHWLTHFDVCKIDATGSLMYPTALAREVDTFIAKMEKVPNHHRLELVGFAYPDDGICIGASLNQPDTELVDETVYGVTKPWGAIRVGDYKGVTGDLSSPFNQDDADRRLISRLEHLVLNVLLFLSATPIEYEVQKELLLRKANARELKPELVEARWVGQSQLRPIRTTEPVKGPVHHTGKHVAQHWRSGHWKRQVFGPGRAERKLIWIQPYQTHEPEEVTHGIGTREI